MGLFSSTPDNPTVVSLANEGLGFYNELQQQQQTMFGENQDALAAITKAWAPVLATGAVPYGYSAGLDSMLQANVIQTASTATSNAENAAALQEKQASGGANVAPTGSNEAINAEILAKGQQAEATGLQQEKTAGYQQGLQNLEGATTAENDVIQGTNPSKAEEAATSEGDLADTAANQEFQESQANSGFSTLGKVTGAIGDVAGAAAKVAGLGAGFAGMGGGGMASNAQMGQVAVASQPASNFSPAGFGPVAPGTFHKGGKIPGKKGKEVHIRALAGETVLPIPKTRKQKTLFDRVLANA